MPEEELGTFILPETGTPVPDGYEIEDGDPEAAYVGKEVRLFVADPDRGGKFSVDGIEMRRQVRRLGLLGGRRCARWVEENQKRILQERRWSFPWMPSLVFLGTCWICRWGNPGVSPYLPTNHERDGWDPDIFFLSVGFSPGDYPVLFQVVDGDSGQ